MSTISTLKYLESDLRIIISESNQKKTIPHIRDKAEKVLALIVGSVDGAEIDLITMELVSTLLLTAELTHSPKILSTTVDALLKLCSSPGMVHGDIFSHIVTVLCKAAYSIMASVPSNTTDSEIDLSLLRCLQVVNLLQTESLRDQFLNEVSLSQILALSTNIITKKGPGPVVSQTAIGVLSHIQLFILDAANAHPASPLELSKLNIPSGSTLTSTGEQMGVAHLFTSPLSSPFGILFAFTHDCVTMSDPKSTVQVPCLLFGSSRIPQSLAFDFLNELVLKTPWHKDLSLITLGKLFLLPIVSRRISAILSDNASITELSEHWLELAANLFRSSLMSYCRHEIEKLVIIMNNFLSFHHRADSRISLVMKCFSTGVVVSQNCRSSTTISTTPNSPLGGDSPVNKSSSRSLIASIIDNVALFIAQSFANIGPDFEERQKIFNSADPAPVEVITSFVASLYRESVSGETDLDYSTLLSTWPAIMSVFDLVVPLSTNSDLAESFENFIFLLSNVRRGLSSAVSILVKLTHRDEWLVHVITRMIEDEKFSMDQSDWTTLIRSSLSRQPRFINFICPTPRDKDKAKILIRTLFPLNAKWCIDSLKQVLTKSPGGLDNLTSLWRDEIDPYIKDSKLDPQFIDPIIQLTFTVCETALASNQDESIFVLETIVFLSENFPSKIPLYLFDLVQNFGDKIRHWKSIHQCISIIGTMEVLKTIEIIVEEFLTENSQFIPEMTINLTQLLPLATTNNSFLIISLVHRCAELFPSHWTSVSKFFKNASLDSRMEVRNCAIKTVSSLVSPDTFFLIEITAAVFEHATSCSPNDRSRDEVESAGIIVHHSQDTEEKRWNESVSCCLRMLSVSTKSFDATPIIESVEMGRILSQIFHETDTPTDSAINLIVDLISSTRKDSLIFADILSSQIRSLEMTKTARLLLSQILAIPGTLPTNLVANLFDLFSKFVNHSSVRGKPIPATVVTENPAGICLVDFANLRIDQSLLPIIPNTDKFFHRPDFIDLIFNPDKFLIDSTSVHLGLRVAELLINHDLPESVRDRFVLNLKNFAISKDSIGIWKYAIDVLIRMNEISSLLEIAESLESTSTIAPIEYRLFTFLIQSMERDDGKFSQLVLHRLEASIDDQLVIGTTSHFAAYIFLKLLGAHLDVSPETTATNEMEFSLENVSNAPVKFSPSLALVNRLCEICISIVSSNRSAEILSIKILDFLNLARNDNFACKIFLALLPARALVLSENVVIRERFADLLARFSPAIKNSC